MKEVHIGTSGWNYEDWRGLFYPDTLPKDRWLEFYAQNFDTIEVNATFYHEMRVSTYEKWRESTPPGFSWAVKASRFITHIRRLRDVREPVQRFFASAGALGDKLSVVLFQLPPSLIFDVRLVQEFGDTLHDILAAEGVSPRCAIEARHKSWMENDALKCLKDADLGFCISDTGGRYPYREAVTTDFAYIRLHGPKELYASSYSEEELTLWAQKICGMDCDVYVYFDNDVLAYAPRNALTLIERIRSHTIKDCRSLPTL